MSLHSAARRTRRQLNTHVSPLVTPKTRAASIQRRTTPPRKRGSVTPVQKALTPQSRASSRLQITPPRVQVEESESGSQRKRSRRLYQPRQRSPSPEVYAEYAVQVVLSSETDDEDSEDTDSELDSNASIILAQVDQNEESDFPDFMLPAAVRDEHETALLYQRQLSILEHDLSDLEDCEISSQSSSFESDSSSLLADNHLSIVAAAMTDSDVETDSDIERDEHDLFMTALQGDTDEEDDSSHDLMLTHSGSDESIVTEATRFRRPVQATLQSLLASDDSSSDESVSSLDSSIDEAEADACVAAMEERMMEATDDEEVVEVQIKQEPIAVVTKNEPVLATSSANETNNTSTNNNDSNSNANPSTKPANMFMHLPREALLAALVHLPTHVTEEMLRSKGKTPIRTLVNTGINAHSEQVLNDIFTAAINKNVTVEEVNAHLNAVGAPHAVGNGNNAAVTTSTTTNNKSMTSNTVKTETTIAPVKRETPLSLPSQPSLMQPSAIKAQKKQQSATMQSAKKNTVTVSATPNAAASAVSVSAPALNVPPRLLAAARAAAAYLATRSPETDSSDDDDISGIISVSDVLTCLDDDSSDSFGSSLSDDEAGSIESDRQEAVTTTESASNTSFPLTEQNVSNISAWDDVQRWQRVPIGMFRRARRLSAPWIQYAQALKAYEAPCGVDLDGKRTISFEETSTTQPPPASTATAAKNKRRWTEQNTSIPPSPLCFAPPSPLFNLLSAGTSLTPHRRNSLLESPGFALLLKSTTRSMPEPPDFELTERMTDDVDSLWDDVDSKTFMIKRATVLS